MASSHGTLRSLSLCKIIVVVLLFSTFKIDRNFSNDGSFLLIARKLNYMQYPSRNSSLWHRRPRGPTLPSPLKALAGLYMLNTSLCASLILLSGDINLNPGPVKDPCFLCNKGCRSNQKAIQCDDCDNWYHVKCIGMKNDEYFDLVSDTSANWICTKCICSLPSHLPDMNDDYRESSSTSHESTDPEIRMLRGFKVGHLNVNRLFNKLDSVKELIDKYSFDILALSETWLTSEISDSEISIKGYSIVRKDRQDSSKFCDGGVLIYVRDGIPFIRQTNFVDDNFECLWIEINRRFCKPLTHGCQRSL